MTDEAESYCPLSHPSHPDRPSKSARTSVLCQGHLSKLAATLTELSTFDADADQASYEMKLARHDGAPLTGTGEKPLPIDPRIADLRVDARDVLASWCQLVAEERHLSPPRNRLEALSGFLGTHLDWCLSQSWVDEFASEAFELGAKAHAILNPSGNRRFTNKIMRCVEVDDDGVRCTGNMWCFLTPDDPYAEAKSALVCDVCGHEVTSDAWMSYGRKVIATEQGTAA